jgi:hypothetical protein
MLGSPKDCRQYAKNCLAKAKEAQTLLMAKRFEGLAHSWMRLADDLERAEALQDHLHATVRKAS